MSTLHREWINDQAERVTLEAPELRQKIVAGGDQFAADLAAYVPPAAAAPTATGRTPENLPALHIEVTGHVTASNLRELGIEPAGRDKRAVLYRESQFAAICEAIAGRAIAAKRAALLPA